MKSNILPIDVILTLERDKVTYSKKAQDGVERIEKYYHFDPAIIRQELKAIEFSSFYSSIGGKAARDEDLENLKMPPFAYIFYFLFALNLKVPTANQVCNKYLQAYCKSTDIPYKYSLKDEYVVDKNHEFIIQHLFGRICRAYNSFNRELELLAQLMQFEDINPFYSIQMDFYDGIDIAIEHQSSIIGIASYMNSAQSLRQRGLKERFRHEYSEHIIMPVVAYFDSSQDHETNVLRWNDVYIYNESVADQIHKTIVANGNFFPMTKIDNPICPACGSIMTKRTAKVGKYAGNEFWGCASYPKCKEVLS